ALVLLVVARVAPDHQRGVAARSLVVGMIIAQQQFGLEAELHLEARHRIAHLAVLDRLEILPDAWIVLPVAPEARQPPAESDALEPEFLAQPLPRLVEPAPDPVALASGIDANLDAVEPFAL